MFDPVHDGITVVFNLFSFLFLNGYLFKEYKDDKKACEITQHAKNYVYFRFCLYYSVIYKQFGYSNGIPGFFKKKLFLKYHRMQNYPIGKELKKART